MGFVDLFRPKWKHRDVETRAAAVRELGPEETEVLEGIARSDSDAGVRRIAIKKLDDPQVLSSIAQHDSDEGLRQMAADKAAGILVSRASAADEQEARAALGQIEDQLALAEVAKQAQNPAVRQAALERITDPKGLAEVARNAPDPQVRVATLEHVTDVAVLRSVALNDSRKEVCLAALGRIEERDALDHVARKAKNKSVRSQARKRLGAMGGPKVSGKKLKAQLKQLCERVEVVGRSSDWAQAGRTIEQSQKEWEALQGDKPAELEQRFAGAVQAFFERLEQHKQRQAEREAEERELQQILGQRVELCEEVERLAGEPEQVARELSQLRERWAALAPIPDAHREVIEQRFEQAAQAAQQRAEERTEVQQNLEQLEQLVQEAEQLLNRKGKPAGLLKRAQSLGQRWQQLRPPDSAAPLRQRLEAVEAELTRRQEREQQQRDQVKVENRMWLEELCARMEQLSGANNLKGAERALKDAQQAFKRHGNLPTAEDRAQLEQRLGQAREKLVVRINELREAEDWKRWSAVPKLEALCVKAEALAEQQDLKRLSQDLRKLQASWKKTGPAPRDKSEALWKRFKEACDAAYARCKEHFAQLEQEREENLTRKLGLCEQVEQLCDVQPDSRDGWEQTASEIKGLQAQWKAIGPVPRKRSDAVWKRFRAACDRFFERRQQMLDEEGGERTENLKRKQELCERVEQLCQVEPDGPEQWEQTAGEIKGLQAQWKTIGPVPRKDSDAVWKRFRAACDAFFDRRHAAMEAKRVEALAAREELCAQLEALGSGEAQEAEQQEAEPVQARALELLGQWRAAGQVPQDAVETIHGRFRAACEAVLTRFPDAFSGTELDPVANLHKLERLAKQAEQLLALHAPPEEPAAPQASAAGSVEQMAEQLRDALAKNALKSAVAQAAPDLRDTLAEVRQLQGDWRQVGPVPGDKGQEVTRRFRAACDALFAMRPERPERAGRGARGAGKGRGDDGPEAQQNLERKEELCQQAEQLAESEDVAAHGKAVRELRRKWKAIGPVPKQQARPLWNRFRRACNRVMTEVKRQRAEADAAEGDGATEAGTSEAPLSASPTVPGGWDASLDSGWDDLLGEEEEDTAGTVDDATDDSAGKEA